MGCTSRGCRFGAKNPKLSCCSLVSGAPLEIAVANDGGRCWGGDNKVTVVVGLHVGLRKPGLRVWGQKLETSPLGLDFGLHPGCRRWRGILWYHRTPCCGIPDGS